MKTKRFQKPFYVSAEELKNYLDIRLDELAEEYNHSASFIIEKILVDALLPKNTFAKELVVKHLYSSDGAESVKQTLSELFFHNSSGFGWASMYRNFKPVIDFCLLNVDKQMTILDTHIEYQNFLNEFQAIVDYVERCSQQIPDIFDRAECQSRSKWLRKFYNNTCEKKNNVRSVELFQIIKDLFFMLDDQSITYCFLRDIVQMSTFNESVQARIELHNIINSISKDWSENNDRTNI